MSIHWWSSLILLSMLVALADNTDPDKNKVKALRKINLKNSSNSNVKQCLWFSMKEYNKESEDKYVFQVVKILQVQLQVTDRMEYFIDVEIARSNCRKPLNHSESCVVQENSKLEKKTVCSFVVGALPWNGDFTTGHYAGIPHSPGATLPSLGSEDNGSLTEPDSVPGPKPLHALSTGPGAQGHTRQRQIRGSRARRRREWG
ncbi:cystatin-8-like [Choloepus didactylus]|uniref:cystatin-8-like n=1 Tax=Choloepus didactylus TaxID=27675 RepID=UPI00189F0C20|nr:cystatin-8-like [Choloepus didactylus]